MKLRELEKSDTPYILEWMHDDTINRFFRFDGSESTEEDVGLFIEKAKTDKDNYHFAVVNDNNEYLGTVSLKSIDRDALAGEYAIVLRKCAQKTGAARFATKHILEFAFDNLGLNRVYLNVLSDNPNAWKFYEHFGFIFEGEFKDHIRIKGELKSLRWYRLLKEEFGKLDI